MPSLWKRDNSPYWTCCYVTATGQRLKKSTKILIRPQEGERNPDGTPKTAADKRREAWETCLAFERAERFAKTGSLTEIQAKKIIAEIAERANGQKMNDYTAEGWLAEWIENKAGTKAAGTLERYRQVKREFLKSLGNRASFPIGNLTAKDIRAYRDAELAAGKAPKTANNGVKIISAAFNAALRQGHITNNPCTALERLQEQTAARDTFTPNEIGKLLKAAEGDWKGAILFGYFTGARICDVANMRWVSIDLAKRVITFTPQKTKKELAIPLHPDLERLLMKSAGIGKAPLFPSLAGRDTGGRDGLSADFAAIMDRAGIAGTVTRHTETGRANKSLSFHSFRHSFNSAMANAGVAQEIRQRLTGHASAEMNKVYTHHELEPLRAAIGTLPSLASK